MTDQERIDLVLSVIETALTTDPSIMEDHPGMQEVIANITRTFHVFSDRKVEFPLVLCDGEWVAVRVMISGVHTGDIPELPATGNPVNYEALMFHRVVDGVIVQQHSQIDSPSLMRQLGINFPGA